MAELDYAELRERHDNVQRLEVLALDGEIDTREWLEAKDAFLRWLNPRMSALLAMAEPDEDCLEADVQALLDRAEAAEKLSRMRLAVLKTYVGHHSSCGECYGVWTALVEEERSDG